MVDKEFSQIHQLIGLCYPMLLQVEKSFLVVFTIVKCLYITSQAVRNNLKPTFCVWALDASDVTR